MTSVNKNKHVLCWKFLRIFKCEYPIPDYMCMEY